MSNQAKSIPLNEIACGPRFKFDYQTIGLLSEAFIYLLMNRKKVMYVGQAPNGIASLRKVVYEHEIDYDTVLITLYPKKYLPRVAAELIAKYLPEHNHAISDNSKWISYNKFKNKFPNFNRWKLRKILQYYDVPTVTIGKILYYDVEILTDAMMEVDADEN